MQAIKDFLDTDTGAFCWSFGTLVSAGIGVLMLGWPETVLYLVGL